MQHSDGLPVNARVVIPWAELEVRASRSGGPGGQHVNTSSTRIELAWNVLRSRALTDEQRIRVVKALGSRISAEGSVRVVASDTRSQRQNRELAEQRLAEAVRRALIVKKVRKRTRPHRGAVEQRLAEKKFHSGKKRDRRTKGDE